MRRQVEQRHWAVTHLATGFAAVLSQGDCIELLYKVGDGTHGAVGIKYEVY